MSNNENPARWRPSTEPIHLRASLLPGWERELLEGYGVNACFKYAALVEQDRHLVIDLDGPYAFAALGCVLRSGAQWGEELVKRMSVESHDCGEPSPYRNGYPYRAFWHSDQVIVHDR